MRATLEMPKENRTPQQQRENQEARKHFEESSRSDDKCDDGVSIDSAYLRSLEEQAKGNKKK
jgi:hypothetical protein